MSPLYLPRPKSCTGPRSIWSHHVARETRSGRRRPPEGNLHFGSMSLQSVSGGSKGRFEARQGSISIVSIVSVKRKQMGNPQSKFPKSTPLGYLLANLKTLQLEQDLRRKRLIFLSTVAWPRYKLDNQSQWPPEGTLDRNVLTDLSNFCQRLGKWSEITYIQGFWALRSRPDLCSRCSLAQVMLAKDAGSQEPEKEESSFLSVQPEDLGFPSLPPYTSPPSARAPPSSSLPTSNPLSPVRPSGPPTGCLESPVSAHTRSKCPADASTPAPHPPTVLAPLREVAGRRG